MTPVEIIQALLGTISLVVLAGSGWLFYKAIEPGWQQAYAGMVGGNVPLFIDETKANLRFAF
jgi:hypothetical protein